MIPADIKVIAADRTVHTFSMDTRYMLLAGSGLGDLTEARNLTYAKIVEFEKRIKESGPTIHDIDILSLQIGLAGLLAAEDREQEPIFEMLCQEYIAKPISMKSIDVTTITTLLPTFNT
jgi:hypothetical protein